MTSSTLHAMRPLHLSSNYVVGIGTLLSLPPITFSELHSLGFPLYIAVLCTSWHCPLGQIPMLVHSMDYVVKEQMLNVVTTEAA
jgi:hypothetical protein